MIAAFHGILAKSQVVAGKTARINFSDTGYSTSSPNWNQINSSAHSTPKALVDTSGAATGWTMTCTAFNSFPLFYSESVSATTNFPADVATQTWYQVANSDINFSLSGLDNSKTYTINLLIPAKTGVTYVTDIVTFGATTRTWLHTATREDIYTGLIPSSGVITGNVDSSGSDVWIIGGMIITEN